ncbi:MAG: hypothetical protein QM775_16530 [Pirellulales bacterium]
MNSPHRVASAPRLKLFNAAAGHDTAADDTPPNPPRRTTAGSNDDLGPQSKVRQFFDRWFKPIVLVGDVDASPKTVYEYEKSLDYWEQLTDDPSLDEIDAWTLAEYKSGLRTVTWRRSPHAQPRPFKAYTIAKHAKQLRAILARRSVVRSAHRRRGHRRYGAVHARGNSAAIDSGRDVHD